jgi:hypothetical protein
MHFCDQGSADFITQNDDACFSQRPLVTFLCPAEGFYGVMKGNHQSSNGVVNMTPAATPGLLPSSEGEVFTWREGAFYGNIFDPGALNPLKPQVRVNATTGQVEEEPVPGSGIWVAGKTVSSLFAGAVYLNMWACSSGNWTLPDGYFERRSCAGVGGLNCAARYAGPCALLCSTGDAGPASGDHDYGDCADLTLQRWASPLTPFLNHPCDLLGPGTLENVLCSTIGELPILGDLP